MHVGYGAGFQHLGGYSDRQFMREELGNCDGRRARDGIVWVTEHHFDNYSISPDVPSYSRTSPGRPSASSSARW